MPERLGPFAAAWTVCVAILAIALVPGCGEPPAAMDGHAGDRPARVRLAVLSPGAAATLVDLGIGIGPGSPNDLGLAIVGKHDFDIVLPDSVPACGHQDRLDYERLLTADPTHIVIEWGERPLPDRLLSLAGEHGWEIVNLRMLTLGEVCTSIERLAEAFVVGPARERGLEVEPPACDGLDATITRARAQAQIRARARTNAARTEPPGPGPRGFEALGRVLLLASPAPDLGAIGPGSYHHEAMRRLGVTPALDTGGPWQRLDAEDLLTLAPEVIVIATPRPAGTPPEPWEADAETAPAPAAAAEATTDNPPAEPPARPPAPWAEIERRLGRAAALDIPAVRHRRVILLTEPAILLPGTPLVRFVERLAEGLAQLTDISADTRTDVGANTPADIRATGGTHADRTTTPSTPQHAGRAVDLPRIPRLAEP